MECTERYSFVADEGECRWFFSHVLPAPSRREAYPMCIAIRSKMLSADERARYGIGRGEMICYDVVGGRGKNAAWTFGEFMSHLYRYECDVRGMVTATGLPYPPESMVVYMCMNPSDEIACAEATLGAMSGVRSSLVELAAAGSHKGVDEQLDRLAKIVRDVRSRYAGNVSRKFFIPYDFDLCVDVRDSPERRDDALSDIMAEARAHFGAGGFFVVSTAGGYHVLVIRRAVHGNPADFVEGCRGRQPDAFDEVVRCGQDFCPVPGTLAYGSHVVRIVNKEDFE